ncbi:MAG TPA: CHAT domain-containing protein [Actinobacteria bacterium]|nr:CHAT domain-containing protein [Actinomycetota bacterium]
MILQARIAYEQKDFLACVVAADQAAELMGRQDRRRWKAFGSLLSLRARASGGDLGDQFLPKLKSVEKDLAEHGDYLGLIDALMLNGRVLKNLGRPKEAAAAFSRVAKLAANGPVLLRIQGRVAEALEAELEGDTRRLGRVARAGLDDLERYRQSLASSELRARAAEYGVELAQIGLRSALAGRRPMRVWSWLERTRASVIGGAIVGKAPPELNPLLAELRETQRLLSAPSADDSDRLRLQSRLARLEGKIRATSWKRHGEGELGVLSPPTQTRLATLRAALADRVLLEYGVVDGLLIAVVVSADAIRFVPMGSIDVVDEARGNLGFALQRLSSPRSIKSGDAARLSADDALNTLDSVLVRPLEPLIGDHRRVVVVPPSDLIGLPWGAMAGLANRAVRIVPSAMMWSATAATTPSSDRVVAIEGPDLEAAADEVQLVSELHGNAKTLRGEESTVLAVLEAVDGAALVHLACHGTLRTDSPTFSGFRMSDGPLTVHDLEGLTSPAHHWVLAACDLGNPGSLSGADLEGVLASLLGGGAGAIIAAITAVPDEASAALMGPLHQAMARGKSLAEALSFAKQDLDQDDPMSFVTHVAFNCYGGG